MDRRHFIKSAAVLTAAGSMLGTNSPALCAAASVNAVPSSDILNAHPAMRYRPMGRTGVAVSALGFGMLRLPMLQDGKTVDEKAGIDMVRYAIEQGLNYVDTAHVYLGGQSEQVVGKALQKGYRERVYLTSKSPWWIMEKPQDFERIFDLSRKRLHTDVIDFYHIHFVCSKGWDAKIVPFRLIEKIEKLKQQGKIRFSGFSFHDSSMMFKKAVDANPDWNFCLIQQNYLDTEHEAGIIGLKYAAARGLGVSVMEPLRNGFLAAPPQEVQAIFAAAGQRSPVEWALDYLWNMPEVSVVVSGMSNLGQVQDNIAYAGRSCAGMLSADAMETLGRAAKRYRHYDGVVPCTGCYHCLPCPKNVAIGYILALVYNQYKANGNLTRARQLYTYMPADLRGLKASACDGCGLCVSRCPQGINIPQVLQKVRDELEA